MSPALANRKTWIVLVSSLFSLGLAIVMAWQLSPSHGVGGYDAEFLKYFGMMLRNGGVPYLEGFDHKPPGAFFLAWLTHPLGLFGYWGLEVILQWIGALSLLAMGLRLSWPYPWLYPQLYLALVMSVGYVGGIGMTRGLLCPFILFASAVLFSRWKWRAAFAGLAVGWVFLLQQNEVIPLLPLAFYGLWKGGGKRRLFGELVVFGVFSLLPFLGSVLWFYWHGALHEYMEDAFLFNSRIYAGLRDFHWGRVVKAYELLDDKRLWMPMVLGAAFHAVFFIEKGIFGIALPLLGCFFLQLVSASLNGAYFPQYFTPLVPYLIIWIASSLFCLRACLTPRKVQWALVAFFAWYFYQFLPYDSPRRRLRAMINEKKAQGISFVVETPLPQLKGYFSQFDGKRGSFFLFRKEGWIRLHTLHNVISPSPYVFTHFWDQIPERWDPEGKRLEQTIAGLEKWKTQAIIDSSNELPMPEPYQSMWLKYRNRRYHSKEVGGVTVYERNEP